MTSKIFETFAQNEAAVSNYVQGKDLLVLSGIRPVLMQLGLPLTRHISGNPNALAHTAAFCDGYQQALRDVFEFKETYLIPAQEDKRQNLAGLATFGAYDLALAKGDLTKGDIDELKGRNNHK